MSDQELLELVRAAEGENTDAQEQLQAREQLFTLLYDELRHMAERALRGHRAAALSPTTLLHETYLSVSQRESAAFRNRGQFMAYASRAMRGLVVDHLRSGRAQKRGGQFEITSLDTQTPQVTCERLHVEKLNDALESLARVDARLAECVDLKFFCGFSFAEIAKMREVSERTVHRDWDKARIVLHCLINDEPIL